MVAQTTSEQATGGFAELRGVLRGPAFEPGDPGYDEARAVYNGMIDKRPGMIARCADAADVIAAVNFARQRGILLAIRGGGHNGAGLGTCDDGLVIDLSMMGGVRVDPDARTARVGGGALLGDVDHAGQPFGLALPSGIISTTGVGGITLGGGIGHLTRRFGLTIDALLEADMVLADGSFITVSEQKHPDLFWAIRGGGGNFGVVTSFLFRLAPVETVIAGPTFWPLEDTPEVLRWYREFILKAPRDLNGFFAFLTVPPVAPFPEELHMRKVCGIVWCYTGREEDAQEIFAPALEVGTPLLHGPQKMPYPMLGSLFDALYPRGDQWYWKADFVTEISDGAIALHARHGATLPTPQSTMHLYPIDGAAHDAARDATAWNYRDANWGMVMVGVDPDPANADLIRDWARAYWEDLHPFSSGGAYVNMMMEEGQDRIRAAYGDNYDRLARIKQRYDPTNLFRVNQNIHPAG